jgi:hypothetical protein
MVAEASSSESTLPAQLRTLRELAVASTLPMAARTC